MGVTFNFRDRFCSLSEAHSNVSLSTWPTRSKVASMLANLASPGVPPFPGAVPFMGLFPSREGMSPMIIVVIVRRWVYRQCMDVWAINRECRGGEESVCRPAPPTDARYGDNFSACSPKNNNHMRAPA